MSPRVSEIECEDCIKVIYSTPSESDGCLVSLLDLAALLEEGESVSHYTSRVSGALYGHFRAMEELLGEARAVGSVENYCLF